MDFTKELEELNSKKKLLRIAEIKVARRFELEVKKMLAKYKRYNYDFTCGNGTFFFSKNGEIVHLHEEERLPKDMKELCTFLEDNSYIQEYIYEIKLSSKE